MVLNEIENLFSHVLSISVKRELHRNSNEIQTDFIVDTKIHVQDEPFIRSNRRRSTSLFNPNIRPNSTNKGRPLSDKCVHYTINQ